MFRYSCVPQLKKTKNKLNIIRTKKVKTVAFETLSTSEEVITSN